MKVFDLAKNLPHPPARHLFCSQEVLDAIKTASEPANEPTTDVNSFLGIQIVLVDDPEERKRRAFVLAATKGVPVLYDDDEGNIIEIHMPYADFILLRFPERKFGLQGKP